MVSKASTFEGFGRHVPGEGSKPCALAIVGEAPGFNEDQTGRPFVGQAGQLLNQCLAQAGLSRDRIYITNAIKRRPPGNRKPTPAEIKWARENELVNELSEVQATIVVAMGDVALRALTTKSGITKHRGVEIPGAYYGTVLPTFHPAYALRNPSIAQTIIQDLRRARVLVEGKPTDEIEVRIIRDVGDFRPGELEDLSIAEVVVYDVETTGLDPLDPKKEMLGVGISVEPNRGYYFLPEAWHVAQHLPISAKYIAHNGKFDNRWLDRYGIYVRLSFDTMLAAYVLDENRSTYKLERLAVEVLGVDPYHTETDSDLAAGKGAEIPVETLAARCVRDVCYTLRLYRVQREEIIKDVGLRRVFQYLMMPSSRLLESVENMGLPLDLDLLEDRHCILKASMSTHLASMQEIAGDEFNFKSTKQLCHVLYEQLGLPIVKRTPGGKPSTDKDVLVALHDRHPFVQHLMDYRKCAKYESSYYNRWKARAVVQTEDTGSGAGERGANGDRPTGNAHEIPHPYPSPDQS